MTDLPDHEKPYPEADYQYSTVLDFMIQAKQVCPVGPTIPSFESRKLRAKLILEEALETVEALGFDVRAFDDGCSDFVDTNKFGLCPHGRDVNLVAIADGCADLKVVTVGTEIACGIYGKPIFEEVMRSNMTKFKDGSVRDDGKIMKGPHYSPPSIEPLLIEQGMQ